MTPQQIDQSIYNQAVSMGIPSDTAKLIVAQARYETFVNGQPYSNTAFKSFNNAFGYKYVGQRKWAIGSGNAAGQHDAQGNADGGHYAAYPNVAYSAGELVDWLYRRQKEGLFTVANLKTPEQYAAALKTGGFYGQSSNEYSSGISSMLKKIAIVAGSAAGVFYLQHYFFFN